jgi:MOSC domain-containing protein YiiM
VDNVENKTAAVDKICVRLQKGSPVLNLEKCSLSREYGISSDFRSGNGSRQLSLLSAETEDIMEKMGKPGLCMKKFMGNILTRNLSYSRLKTGTTLKLGDAVLEITEVGKECFEECSLIQSKSFCPLVNNCAFARVVQDGEIIPGTIIEITGNL